MPTIDDRATIDIETSGGTVPLETHGNETISVHIRGDGAVDYVVDVNDHPDNDWIEDVKSGLLTGSTDYDETFVTGAAFVRIRATTGTGVAGNSATVYLASGGT